MNVVFSGEFNSSKCAEETAAMLKELRYAYTARQVPVVLRWECDEFIYYKRFGSDREVCHAIIDHLVNTWKGDQDYEEWCSEVYTKRHTAKSADEIPVKEAPEPRTGKYADVKEWSYANDAHPEKPCHGAKPCLKRESADSADKPAEPLPRSSALTARPCSVIFSLAALLAIGHTMLDLAQPAW
mmetsp:Transcript_160379/g.295588  ORF Transcript_160379/g.295588 Transcript_160379/m.295588 type:complete len:184 (-) Transcript_160379:32-583(-)